MILENLAQSQLVENLGWTLLHSIWQIALVAACLFAVLRVISKTSANLRYLASIFALLLTLILPLATFFWLSQNPFGVKQSFIESKAVNTTIFIDESQPIEALPTTVNAPANNASSEAYFVSIENLQNNFAKNFSTFAPFLVGLWILGIAFSAVRLMGGIWQLHIFKTQEVSSPSDEWQQRFEVLCERLKIQQTVQLVQSKIVQTPMVIGWFKPVILIPVSVFLNIHPHELETIIAHELVHVRRRDYLVNLVQNFVEILFFYHPAVWWISAQIRAERECACDDAVVRILDNAHIVYANALANLEEFRQSAKQTASPVLVAANGGKLMQRIQRIINQNKNAKKGRFQNSLWSASLVSALILALVFSLFSAIQMSPVNAQMKSNNNSKKIAVGFVSIPPIYREGADKSLDETAGLLIEKLTTHRIPAIGFVTGNSIALDQILQEKLNNSVEKLNNVINSLREETGSNSENAAKMREMIEKIRETRAFAEKTSSNRSNVVRMWRDAGLEIGIGGFRHIWFYDTPYNDYVANVEKNEQITKAILDEKNLPLKYFSYPFLNTGKTVEDKNRFENWLNDRGLRSVKYTFDNQEWMYSFAYDEARKGNDVNAMRDIRAEYLDYMTKMTEHYETYSQNQFGRDIAQTLVLTPSRLVADTADEFFGMLKTRGYQFVSMDEAQSDSAYETPETFANVKAGISWFERWQIAQGRKLLDEPKVSDQIQRTWEKRSKVPPPPPPPAPPAPPVPPKKQT